MAKPYVINITDGTGSGNILNGSYSASAYSNGYDTNSLSPSTIDVTSDVDSYAFTVSASGSLTLHVSEDGTSGGTSVVGAKFIRCDKNGNTYGNEITSGSDGNATFNNVPYASSGAPTIYYKQTSSDGEHDFDSSLKSITLATSSETQEVINTTAKLKTITLQDANYSGLNIEVAEITLS